MNASEFVTMKYAGQIPTFVGKEATMSLSLLLHSRTAHKDFKTILQEPGFDEDGSRLAGARGGVIHSFTGTVREMNDLVIDRYSTSRFN